jgi:hypothetical protein
MTVWPGRLVLLLSGGLGFAVGMLEFGEWQIAVETAQVVAGIVDYPSSTPAYIYHTKLWTIVHQLLTPLLWLGLSEIQLSQLLSGILGMMSFAALSMFVYAVSRDAWLAIAAAPVIVISRLAEFGVIYPVFLVGTPHTYGSLGLSWFVLTIALIGAGWVRSGALLLGLAPAIHASLGAWLGIIVAICVALNFKQSRSTLRRALPYLIVGITLTAGSLLVQLLLIADAPDIDRLAAARYLSKFVEIWDGHRQPVSLQADGVWLNAGSLGLAVIWLTFLKKDLPEAGLFVLRAVAVAALLGFAFIWITWRSPASLPANLLVLMPARLLNFNAMTFAALVLGLSGAYRRTWWSPVLVAVFITALLLGGRSMIWDWVSGQRHPWWLDSIETWRAFKVVSGALIALAAWERFSRGGSLGWLPVSLRDRLPRLMPLMRKMMVVPALFLVTYAWRGSAITPPVLLDRTNDPLFRVASEGNGLLLSGGNLFMVQLRTRRPVLVDGGGLDGLPYALEGGPVVERILRDIYAIDFFNPPAEARHTGVIPSEYTKSVWEGYPRERWRQIGERYHVTQILTNADWDLDLPTVAQSGSLRLYEVPAAGR